MSLVRAVPALPVASVTAAATAYAERLGFAVVHLDPAGLALVSRDEVVLQLWQSGDATWRDRPLDPAGSGPVRSGAEDFLAGTASCRIACAAPADVDALHAELAATGMLHPTDPGAPVDTDHGTHEVAALDVDGNLLTFFAALD